MGNKQKNCYNCTIAKGMIAERPDAANRPIKLASADRACPCAAPGRLVPPLSSAVMQETQELNTTRRGCAA